MRKRDIAKRATVKSPEKWSVYKQLRNALMKKIKFAITMEEHQHNPKKMWQTTNKVLDRSSNSTMPSSLIIEGKRLSRERDILQASNHHFVLVGQT